MSSIASKQAVQAEQQTPAITRTRRNHGVFRVGEQLAAVYSSRRGGHERPVLFELGNGPLFVSGQMTAQHARAMARALQAAADAAEASGRQQ